MAAWGGNSFTIKSQLESEPILKDLFYLKLAPLNYFYSDYFSSKLVSTGQTDMLGKPSLELDVKEFVIVGSPN